MPVLSMKFYPYSIDFVFTFSDCSFYLIHTLISEGVPLILTQ